MTALIRSAKNQLWELARKTSPGYDLWLRRRYHLSSSATPPPGGRCSAVLLQPDEIDSAARVVDDCGLPRIGIEQKFWDALVALRVVLSRTTKAEWVLDGGAETYSAVLPWLSRFGYRRLIGCNLAFDRDFRVGPIRYEGGDITRTHYPAGHFGAVTCMSVIEHGVDERSFLKEAHRILRADGTLVISTDYWCERIDTGDKKLFGQPVRMYTPPEVRRLIEIGSEEGFRLLDPIDLRCEVPVVEWGSFKYTFLVLSFARD